MHARQLTNSSSVENDRWSDGPGGGGGGRNGIEGEGVQSPTSSSAQQDVCCFSIDSKAGGSAAAEMGEFGDGGGGGGKGGDAASGFGEFLLLWYGETHGHVDRDTVFVHSADMGGLSVNGKKQKKKKVRPRR